MTIFDYDCAPAADCGQLTLVAQDIYISPFWTEEYCRSVIAFLNQHPNVFFDNESNGYGTSEASLSLISNYWKVRVFHQIVQKIMPPLMDVFPMMNFTGFHNPNFIRYGQNDQKHLELHQDNSGVSFLIKLNNKFDGGETVFPRQHYHTGNVPVGSIVMWPGQITHPHRANEVSNGTKYSLSIWTWPCDWTRETGSDLSNLYRAFDKLKL